jgi:flagellar hook-length control protein FliK
MTLTTVTNGPARPSAMTSRADHRGAAVTEGAAGFSAALVGVLDAAAPAVAGSTAPAERPVGSVIDDANDTTTKAGTKPTATDALATATPDAAVIVVPDAVVTPASVTPPIVPPVTLPVVPPPAPMPAAPVNSATVDLAERVESADALVAAPPASGAGRSTTKTATATTASVTTDTATTATTTGVDPVVARADPATAPAISTPVPDGAARGDGAGDGPTHPVETGVEAIAATDPSASGGVSPVSPSSVAAVESVAAQGAPTIATVSAPVASSPAAPAPAAPTPTASAPTADPTPLANQLAKPIFSLQHAGAGEHVVTVTVNPESLGPVTVRAHVDAAGMRVELFAPTDAGRDAIRSILGDLKRDLAGQGLSSTLDLSSQNQPSDRRNQAAERGFGEPAAAARTAAPDPQPTLHRPTSTLDVLA